MIIYERDDAYERKRFLDQEIKTVEKLLYPEEFDIESDFFKQKYRSPNVPLGNWKKEKNDIKWIRSMFKLQIERGSVSVHHIPPTGNFEDLGDLYQIEFLWRIEARTYYFYLQFLKDLQASGILKISINPQGKHYTMAQISLCYIYLEEVGLDRGINLNNKEKIAAKFNFNSPTSGQKLLDTYYKLNKMSQRVAKGKYKVRDIEKAIELLSDFPKAKSKAEDELILARAKNTN